MMLSSDTGIWMSMYVSATKILVSWGDCIVTVTLAKSKAAIKVRNVLMIPLRYLYVGL